MMIAEPLPSWVQDICSKLTQDNIFDDGQAPNHILVNEYTSGQGIMPHFDGPIYAPTIATISLQSHTVLNFYDPLASEDNEENIKPLKERLKFGILVEPRSLLVLKKDLYEKYLHGIEEVESDVLNEKVLRLSQDARLMKDNSVLERKTRISLTVRQVKKRSKMMLKLGR